MDFSKRIDFVEHKFSIHIVDYETYKLMNSTIQISIIKTNN